MDPVGEARIARLLIHRAGGHHRHLPFAKLRWPEEAEDREAAILRLEQLFAPVKLVALTDHASFRFEKEQGAERRAFEQAMMSSASQPDSPVSAPGPGADEATTTQQGQGGASQEKKAGVGAAGSPEALPAADNKMPPREGTVGNEAGGSQ